MDPDGLVRAIRAALDETERLAKGATDGPWTQEAAQVLGGRDALFVIASQVQAWNRAHIAHNDPAAVLRRVAADRELVNMAENAFLSAGVFRDIDERWGAVEMQYLHVMRTLARGLGITPEETDAGPSPTR